MKIGSSLETGKFRSASLHPTLRPHSNALALARAPLVMKSDQLGREKSRARIRGFLAQIRPVCVPQFEFMRKGHLLLSTVIECFFPLKATGAHNSFPASFPSDSRGSSSFIPRFAILAAFSPISSDASQNSKLWGANLGH